MKKVYIKYDPYEMKSMVVVDGKEIQKNKHCDVNLKRYLDADVHMPIQSWIDPIGRDNWNGLLETICLMGDKDIVVEFSGRKIDYESVQEALIAQNETRKIGAKLTFCEITDEIVSDFEMKKNIDEVINLMLTDYFEKIVRESKSSALINKYTHLKETYEEIETEEFRIVFAGTYSSGKSSLINALIRKNLLPTKKGICTAKICRIIHCVDINCLALIKYVFEGKQKHIECNNEQEVQDIISQVESTVEFIEVYTDLSCLYPQGMSKDVKIVIVDTPGTSSGTGNDDEKSDEDEKSLSKESHLEITKKALVSKQKEMVILVSDYKCQDIGIVDLLDIIEESAEQDGGAFNDRFLFVMNMCDELDYSEADGSLGGYIKKYITNLKKVPNSSRIRNIVNPRIFPITSGAALAVINGYTTQPGISETKTKKAELFEYYEKFCKKVYYYEPAKLTDNFKQYVEEIKAQNKNYHNFCLEEQSAVSEATKYKYNKALDGNLSVPERILIHSGVPALENAIQDYIKSYAYPIKVRQLLGCFTDILDELNSFNKLKMEALVEAKKAYSGAVASRERTEIEKAQEEQRKATLVRVKEKMDFVKDRIDQINETVPEINEIRSSFYDVKSSIANKVAGRVEVSKKEGDDIIREISEMIVRLVGCVDSTIKIVKDKKRASTNELYNEFIEYLQELEKAGLMTNGNFSLKDTVAYKKIIDKDSFKKAEEKSRQEANPNKEHIEFGYGIDNFFSSIKRAWETRKEPETIQKTYINIEKYISENITPIEGHVDEYVSKLKQDYQDDIKSLKTETKERVVRVIGLINEKDQDIIEMKQEVAQIASDEKTYAEQVNRLDEVSQYIGSLIAKIAYTQV